MHYEVNSKVFNSYIEAEDYAKTLVEAQIDRVWNTSGTRDFLSSWRRD